MNATANDQDPALAVYHNELIAPAVSPSDRPSSAIARWDGVVWTSLFGQGGRANYALSASRLS